jgi:hypothetical protein
MGIRVECDWCRKPIEAGEPYVSIEIEGKVRHGARGPEDVSEPARIYCGADRYHDDDPAACGHLVEPGEHHHRPSCASRVIAALSGAPDGRVDMGMEWRLVAQGAPKWEHITDGPIELLKVKDKRTLVALRAAGVETVRELSLLTEAQWLAIPGIKYSRAEDIRVALCRHEKAKPAQLLKEQEALVSA